MAIEGATLGSRYQPQAVPPKSNVPAAARPSKPQRPSSPLQPRPSISQADYAEAAASARQKLRPSISQIDYKARESVKQAGSDKTASLNAKSFPEPRSSGHPIGDTVNIQVNTFIPDAKASGPFGLGGTFKGDNRNVGNSGTHRTQQMITVSEKPDGKLDVNVTPDARREGRAWVNSKTLAARVAELEAKLGGPPKTPDNSSLPPSQGEKPNRPGKAKIDDRDR